MGCMRLALSLSSLSGSLLPTFFVHLDGENFGWDKMGLIHFEAWNIHFNAIQAGGYKKKTLEQDPEDRNR